MKAALATFTAVVLLGLYAPLAVMAVFSFNDSKLQVKWVGFSSQWYARLADNHEIAAAVENTAILAAGSALLATALGTLAALAARRRFRGHSLYKMLVSLPLMLPDIVIAIALLALYRIADIKLSLLTALLAHATFCLSYVAVVVSARLQSLNPILELAAQDLGATPAQAFWKVTFPHIRPAVISGALLAATLSFDDFAITYFTAGVGNSTLPVKIFSMVRFGVTPEINAVSVLILAVSLSLMVLSLKFSKGALGAAA